MPSPSLVRFLALLTALANIGAIVLWVGLAAPTSEVIPPAVDLPTPARIPSLAPLMLSSATPSPATETATTLLVIGTPAALTPPDTPAAPMFPALIEPMPTVATPQPTKTAAPTLTPTPTLGTLMPLDIDFERVYPLALEFRAPVRGVLEQNRALLGNTHRLTVSAYRDTYSWAKVTLVPTDYVERGWSNVETLGPFVVQIILHQVAREQWAAYLMGSAGFAAVANLVPREFVDPAAVAPLIMAPYRFPWPEGQTWWAVQGWHDGNAIDFQPDLNARFAVLAAQAGILREICSDGYQSLLQIEHADGRATYYLHVTLSLRVCQRLLDQPVRQGQYLGEIINRAQFRTACGRGYSRHLHFAVTDRALMIDDYPIGGVADTASCCARPPTYRSSNVRVDATRDG